jgi:hypothetical protein
VRQQAAEHVLDRASGRPTQPMKDETGSDMDGAKAEIAAALAGIVLGPRSETELSDERQAESGALQMQADSDRGMDGSGTA